MKLLRFLLRSDMKTAVAAGALSAISGLGSAALIATVSNALTGSRGSRHSESIIALAVAAALIAKVGGGMVANLLLGRLSQKSILSLCVGLCRRVAATPLRELERMGTPRILTCLTEDVTVLSGAIQALPLLLVNSVVLVTCAVYLAWLSWTAVLVLTDVMGVAVFCYGSIIRKAYPAIRNARLGKETLFRHFRALTDGIKELKVNRERREAFLREELDAAAEYYRKQSLVALNRHALADGWSQMMFGFLLGSLIFVLPEVSHITQQQLVKFVLVSIYVMSPAWNLVRALPALATGKASLDRMEELGFALHSAGAAASSASPAVLMPSGRRESDQMPPLVEFRGVAFSYGQGSEEAFTLGPLDLTLYPGELVFIIGGNGSGKSSLVKLLTGLYTPTTGEIRVDGEPLSENDNDNYRQLFSVVYSDFYLFDRILGFSGGDLEERAKEYVAALDLSEKVAIEGSSLSTIALSQGQRRRLALLAAYLEDRPVYVLDEWAADQDPAFREIFYLRLLPELKRRGKTVVVVTHDDRYFLIGDRTIKLDCGRVVHLTANAVSA